MVKVINTQDNALIGEISDEQLQFLIDQLEEEALEDQDYAITAMTLAYFEEVGGDSALIAMLRSALGVQEEIVIRWAGE
jgi:hypothetical protein